MPRRACAKPHFAACQPLERLVLVSDTDKTQLEALRLRCWCRRMHHLVPPTRQDWVVTVLFVAARLRASPPFAPMPTEMWLAILELILDAWSGELTWST